jgi:protein associated with RNAse G/E
MRSQNDITVRILKHDGTEHRHWQAKLSRQDESLLVLDAEFDADVSHDLMGEIKRGTRTVEYYWLDRWYSIFRFLDDEGGTRLWYCNINTPPSFAEATLTCIDMDIDVVAQPNLSYSVLDEDEFAANAERYSYSDQEKAHVHAALHELASMIEGRQFPFREDYLAPDETS